MDAGRSGRAGGAGSSTRPVRVEIGEAGERPVGDQQALEVVADAPASASSDVRRRRAARRAGGPRPASRASGGASVTVHALHRRSRIAGSTGCSESFQSPWP